MTTAELHKILDDENRKLSLAELKQVIYEMKQDAFNEFCNIDNQEKGSPNSLKTQQMGFYQGEQNAFQIVLDLLEHLDEWASHILKDEYILTPKYKVGDTIYAIGWDYSTKPNPTKKVFEKKITKVFVGKRKITYWIVGDKGRIEEKFLHEKREIAEQILNGTYKI